MRDRSSRDRDDAVFEDILPGAIFDLKDVVPDSLGDDFSDGRIPSTISLRILFYKRLAEDLAVHGVGAFAGAMQQHAPNEMRISSILLS